MSTSNKITATIAIMLMIVLVYTMIYFSVIKDFQEVEPRDYVHAEEYYKNKPGLEEMYCEALKDHKLTNREYMKLMRKSNKLFAERQNELGKEKAEQIKKEGCEK